MEAQQLGGRKREREADPEEEFPLLPITSAATVRKCATLPLRETDVFVCSFPKSGTTWMQHIVHTLATDGESPLPHISDACPFFEVDRTWAIGDEPVLAEVVQSNHEKISRRIFNTHLRWCMMPRDHAGARYVYMTRRAVDACVSFYHHLSHQAEEDGGFAGTQAEFVKEWTEGRAPFGSWSAHLRSWVGEAAPSDARVLVVSYEDLRADPRAQVRRVNAHCGFGLSDARIDELLPRFEFAWMRTHEAAFNPRSVRWVERAAASGAAGAAGAAGGSEQPPPSKEERAEEEEAVKPFHFIRAGRVGDGERAFGPAERESLRAMAARTFPDAALPEYILKLLR